MFSELLFWLPVSWFCWRILFPLISIIIHYRHDVKRKSARRWLRVSGEWAVVTGACDPLGRAYACELAAEKLNVLLIDADKAELDELVSHIGQTYGIQVRAVLADLTTTADYDAIAREIDALPSIGCVVNAAQVREKSATPGSLTTASFDFIERIAVCNMQSMAAITRMCLAKLARQPPYKAALINVSSALATIPCASHPLYAATKTFCTAFTRALQLELPQPSLIIQVVNPGPLTLNRTSSGDATRSGTLLAPSATKFVRSALSMVGVEDETCGYLPHAVLALFLRYVPSRLIKKTLSRLGATLACEAKTT